MPQITAASLRAVLAERFADFRSADFRPAPEPNTGALLRDFFAYARALEGQGRSNEAQLALDTVEEIVTSAAYDLQDLTIVELVDAIEDEALVARLGPASRKWRNYHLRLRGPGSAE